MDPGKQKIWIKGLWLHIHVKKEIRVGTVEIRQNFNTINAKGHNIRPKTAESETPPKETTWFYTLCKVVDDDSARDFIGCYQASNISQQTTKDGIHVMQIIGCDSKTGFANRMVGVFRDTVRISPDSVVDIGNQAGQLYFFSAFPKRYGNICSTAADSGTTNCPPCMRTRSLRTSLM